MEIPIQKYSEPTIRTRKVKVNRSFFQGMFIALLVMVLLSVYMTIKIGHLELKIASEAETYQIQEKALQELNNENESLESTVFGLKENIYSLETLVLEFEGVLNTLADLQGRTE